MHPDNLHNRCRFAHTNDPEEAAKICREHYDNYQWWRVRVPSHINPAGKAYKRYIERVLAK